MKYLYLILFWTLFVQSCKTKEIVTTKTVFAKDSISHFKQSFITPSVRNYTVIENPCKDSIIKPINKEIQIGGTRVIIKTVKGDLVTEIITKTDTVFVEKIVSVKENNTTNDIYELETRKVVPKWAWYLLITVIVYVAYRVLRIMYPVIRFLPY